MPLESRLVIIGGGNMAAAIVHGLLGHELAGFAAAGAVNVRRHDPAMAASLITVCEPDAERRRSMTRLGVAATPSHAEALAPLAADPSGTVLLAVKPQTLPALPEQVRALLPPACGLISILAGTPISKLSAILSRPENIIRAMPNTAVGSRLGTTALARGPGVAKAHADFAVLLFGALGDAMWIDESLMDAFTAIAGSGPAYAYLLAEAMALAGERLGFEPALADRIARTTLLGAAGLLAGPHAAKPAQLRAAVTSKGGTTEAAMRILEDRAVVQAFVDAITRARDRGRELAAE